jgi:MinD superfamily P-loop ATPase
MSAEIPELVVISGKGGTGKTSLVASLAALAENCVLADCDVDAADLHLVLEPEIVRTEDFSAGKRATILHERCTACGKCRALCRFEAIDAGGPSNSQGQATFRVDPIACEGCGVCAWFCPHEAIDFAPVTNGQWFVSRTRPGSMVHARLGVAEENSGKLVTTVRNAARRIAQQQGASLILIDGSPGTGCPVIASISAADAALIVTEPTLSGLHDLMRVADVAEHFSVPAMICINKWDLNPEVADEIERYATRRGLPVLGRVRYDAAVTAAQIRKRSIVEHTDAGSAADIRSLWSLLEDRLRPAGRG